MNKYLNYNLEQLLEDRAFVAWVLHGYKNPEWNKFTKDNPAFNPLIQKARKIILLLVDKYETLDEESVLLMWQEIDNFDKIYQQKIKRNRNRKLLSWAASFFIVTLSIIGIRYMNSSKEKFSFSDSDIPQNSNDARLVLSSGESINMQNDKSTISLINDNIVINQDSIIDISEKESENQTEVQINEVIVPYGKKMELLLADGTKVWVNAGSRFAFPSKFSQKTREVHLEGEAYFEVAKNEAQPFFVKTGDVNVKVLGTHFNISAYKEDKNIETVLLEGSIMMTNPKMFGLGKNELLLKPNQKACYNKEEKTVNVNNETNAETYIAWTEGWLEFSRESLNSVFVKLERYYNVDIETPGKFKDELISGKLDLKDSLHDVLVVLEDIAKIRSQKISDKKVYVEKKNR